MIPKNITREHIISAIKKILLDGNKIPLDRESRVIDLDYEGNKFPLKYVLSAANQFSNASALEASSFTSREARRVFEKLGFTIVDKGSSQNYIWIEKTLVQKYKHRISGEYALGNLLWSPIASQSGSDIYKNMRLCKEGDLVLHFIDNKHISGISIVEYSYKEKEVRIGSSWDGNCYFITLKNYYKFKNPIDRSLIFTEKNKAKLLEILISQEEVFYTSGLQLRQGAYLTPCGFDLLFLLNDIYKSMNGNDIPYIENFLNEGSDKKMIEDRKKEISSNSVPKNLILYGPPGTGKTYNTINWALKAIDSTKYGVLLNDPSRRDELINEYQKLIKKGQISFCTFHQSYSYEDFIEGLRSDEHGNFQPKDGIFKQICQIAKSKESSKISSYAFFEDKVKFHKMSLGNSQKNDIDIFNYCVENNCVALGYGRDEDYTESSNIREIREKFLQANPDKSSEDFNIYAMSRFKLGISIGDILLISSGNLKIQAIAKVTGNYFFDQDTDISYNHFREVEWLFSGEPIPVSQFLKEKVLSQQTVYEFKKQDLIIENIKDLISPKVDPKNNLDNFVLIIDEINRGNISKIFGELITLIEPDKRLNEKNEIQATLPYTNELFGIPNNLYIIGTMNTADRSIALLDTALRRRFDFIECLSNPNLISDDVDGINVSQLLTKINQRIEFLLDRDHTIGHSYFMVENLNFEKLTEVMLNKIIPLLQEYFYDDWIQIERILGGSSSSGTNDYFLQKRDIKPSNLFNDRLLDDLEMKSEYTIIQKPSHRAFLNIYQTNNKESD